MLLRKNIASQRVFFALVNATTGAALTGATVTARVSIDSAAQATAGGTVTELGNGHYRFDAAQADTNGDFIGFLFTATNAVPVSASFRTVQFDPGDAAGLGLSRIDAAITTRASQASVDAVDDFVDTEVAAIKAKTDLLTFNPSNHLYADVRQWIGVAPNALIQGLVPAVEPVVSGTFAGTPSTTAADLSTGSTTDNWYNRARIRILTGSAAGQSRFISGYVGATKTISFSPALITAPAADDAFVIEPQSRVDAQVAAYVAGAITSAAFAAGAITATAIDTDAIDAAALDLTAINEIRDAIFAQAIEGSTTFIQSVRLANAVAGGKLSGAATTTNAIRDLADSKTRISATVDADGNRTAITLDLT